MFEHHIKLRNFLAKCSETTVMTEMLMRNSTNVWIVFVLCQPIVICEVKITSRDTVWNDVIDLHMKPKNLFEVVEKWQPAGHCGTRSWRAAVTCIFRPPLPPGKVLPKITIHRKMFCGTKTAVKVPKLNQLFCDAWRRRELILTF